MTCFQVQIISIRARGKFVEFIEVCQGLLQEKRGIPIFDSSRQGKIYWWNIIGIVIFRVEQIRWGVHKSTLFGKELWLWQR